MSIHQKRVNSLPGKENRGRKADKTAADDQYRDPFPLTVHNYPLFRGPMDPTDPSVPKKLSKDAI
ncbi:MAG TPA: hypothetical protein VHX38_24875 [Pseudonocardiaceae bacterium]|nr:hypothetical protein [Pseudonocardiaceae bacterium]